MANGAGKREGLGRRSFPVSAANILGKVLRAQRARSAAEADGLPRPSRGHNMSEPEGNELEISHAAGGGGCCRDAR